jgi:hypothetical protein
MKRAAGTLALGLGLGLALGLAGCAAESGSEVDEQGAAATAASSSALARPLLDGVASAHPSETGVSTWEVAAVVKDGRSYLLLTGARAAPRRPIELLVAVGAAGAVDGVKLEFGNEVRLTPAMREAISGDVEVLAGRLAALGESTIGVSSLQPLGGSRCHQFSFPGGRYLSAALRVTSLVVIGGATAGGCLLFETGAGALVCTVGGASSVANFADGIAFARECF